MDTYYCPHCNAHQETFEYFEGDRLVVRCQVCGFPVEEGVIDQAHLAFQPATLLFIADDPLLRTFFTDFARAHGFQSLMASDGASGMALAKQERPDLILLDVRMPTKDRYDVCRQMRADPAFKKVPIIILTAMTDPTHSVDGFKAGATLAIEKTTDARRFLDTIMVALALNPTPPTRS